MPVLCHRLCQLCQTTLQTQKSKDTLPFTEELVRARVSSLQPLLCVSGAGDITAIQHEKYARYLMSEEDWFRHPYWSTWVDVQPLFLRGNSRWFKCLGPNTPVGDLGGGLRSWPQPGPVLDVTGIQERTNRWKILCVGLSYSYFYCAVQVDEKCIDIF